MTKKKRRKIKSNGRGLQVATLCLSTSLVLILLGLVVFIGLTANNLTNYVKENLVVTVIFDDNTLDREAAVTCRKIQTHPYVAHLKYITREEALEEQSKALGSNPTEFLGMNPFVPSAEINIKADCANADSLKWITKQIKGYDNVSEVTYQKDLMESVNSNIQKIMIGMMILAVLLTFISFSLINNMVRLTIFARRFSINIMKLVGASWSFIRKPFIGMALTEGLIAGIFADMVLGGLVYALYTYEPDIMNVVTWEVLAITGSSVLLFGLLISTLCVYFSVNAFLKMPTRKLYKV